MICNNILCVQYSLFRMHIILSYLYKTSFLIFSFFEINCKYVYKKEKKKQHYFSLIRHYFQLSPMHLCKAITSNITTNKYQLKKKNTESVTNYLIYYRKMVAYFISNRK